MTIPTSPDLAAVTPSGTAYQLGAPIALAEFLALPPDGIRYDRDEDGRLVEMSPDDHEWHRRPLGDLVAELNRRLARPLCVYQEAGLALPAILSLKTGEPIRRSFLGPKVVAPDVSVFDRRPELRRLGPRARGFEPTGLRLVIELLSPSTWRSDLGHGKADEVDRWRSYWAAGVPEYWILNMGIDGTPLPTGSGLFLTRGESDWCTLPTTGQTATESVNGVLPVRSGTVTSAALPGLTLDLDAFMTEAGAPRP